MATDYQFIVIGSGFGGQCAAIELLRRGFDNLLMLERRSFMGGTWCQNTYPGAQVDVQSPLYSLSFEPYDWSQMFAEQDELRQYTEMIIEKYQLRERCRVNANVTSVDWDDEQAHWRINLEDGDSLTAQFVINASGPLSSPVIPDFEGKDSFKGVSFHTNQWDHSVDYCGKRVAIIGSGASAAQVIPAIAPDVEHLHVFQRTPHWVLPRPDYQFKPWQRRWLKKSWVHRLVRTAIYWGLEFRVLGFKYSRTMLDLLGGRAARRLIKEQIQDPELQAKVTPEFTIGCKRVLVSNTLYPAYCRDNVTLYDKHNGIKRITPDGIETQQGEQLQLDMIVYSTGFDATDGVISYPVTGRNNTALREVWDDYPRAYLGTCIPDFPNFFVVTGPNTGIGHTSALFVIESQMRYIMGCIEKTLKQHKRSIEVTAAAEDDYTRHIHQQMQRTVWQSGGCKSWYQSKSGKVIAMYPGFSFSYRYLASRFKKQHHQFR